MCVWKVSPSSLHCESFLTSIVPQLHPSCSFEQPRRQSFVCCGAFPCIPLRATLQPHVVTWPLGGPPTVIYCFCLLAVWHSIGWLGSLHLCRQAAASGAGHLRAGQHHARCKSSESGCAHTVWRARAAVCMSLSPYCSLVVGHKIGRSRVRRSLVCVPPLATSSRLDSRSEQVQCDGSRRPWSIQAQIRVRTATSRFRARFYVSHDSSTCNEGLGWDAMSMIAPRAHGVCVCVPPLGRQTRVPQCCRQAPVARRLLAATRPAICAHACFFFACRAQCARGHRSQWTGIHIDT